MYIRIRIPKSVSITKPETNFNFLTKGAEGLSVEGKELLYNESIKYTNILLRYNQRRLGLIEGAQRLTECSRLINLSIENEYNFRSMVLHEIKYFSISTNYSKCSNFTTKFLERSD
ncbi:unnamed protein product [Meloidogyne enterolobii]|uniref:Uncharacterized protein n=1 Tax=Meloidogyne enterolobii TaxID=390850 RepID=A0ACB0YLN1_MELEN